MTCVTGVKPLLLTLKCNLVLVSSRQLFLTPVILAQTGNIGYDGNRVMLWSCVWQCSWLEVFCRVSLGALIEDWRFCNLVSVDDASMSAVFYLPVMCIQIPSQRLCDSQQQDNAVCNVDTLKTATHHLFVQNCWCVDIYIHVMLLFSSQIILYTCTCVHCTYLLCILIYY